MLYKSENNPIYLKWKAVGGQNVLGDEIQQPRHILNGSSTYEVFLNGAIFNSPVFGTAMLSISTFGAWWSLKSDLQEYIGNLIGDSLKTASGAQAAYFERGMIVVNPSGQAFEVHGFIYAHYRQYNDVNGQLGLPVSNEEDAPNGGRVSRFENGDIYWHSATGAYTVYGAIREHWLSLGGAGGFLGYPLTDEQPVIKDGAEIGRSNRFEGGVIFWKPDRGAWEVHGNILQAWEKIHGGATGHLGFPVSDQTSTPTSGGSYSNFEHGVIVWHPSGPYAGSPKEFGTRAFKSMELYVQRLWGTGGDEVTDDSSLEIYIWHHIEVQNRLETPSNATLSDGRVPSSGYWDRSEVTLGWPPFPVTDCVQGELKLIVMFEGWDRDFDSDDDRLGTINHGDNRSPYNKHLQPVYSVDNLWGYLASTLHEQDAFHMDYTIREKSQPYDANKAFREQWFWKFHNFSNEKLDRETYAATFSDVDSQGIQWINPLSYLDEGWESLYYHAVFKGIAKGGNCFGMSLEAIYAMVQRSLFNEPIYRFGHPDSTSNKPDPNTDSAIIREINIKQAYQLGICSINWFLKQFFNGMTHNPREVFIQSRAAHQRGDYPVLSLSQFWGGSAHTVLPIHWDDTSEPWEIWLADPNHQWNGSKDSDNRRKILIYNDNHFEYDNKYNGGEWLGARLFYTPYSVLSEEPHTPKWETLALLLGGVVILAAEDGQTVQITDDAGRTFYEPNLNGVPTQWEQIRRDPTQRIPGLARLPLMGENGQNTSFPELYYLQGDTQTLHCKVSAKKTNTTYHWATQSPTLSATVKIEPAIFKIGEKPSNLTDTISLERRGGDLSLAIVPNNVAKKFRLQMQSRAGINSTQQKPFIVDNLSLSPGHKLRLHLKDAGQTLHIENFGSKLTFQVSGNGSSMQNVAIEANESVRIQPSPWKVERLVPSLRRFLETKGFNPSVGIRSAYPSDMSLRSLVDE